MVLYMSVGPDDKGENHEISFAFAGEGKVDVDAFFESMKVIKAAYCRLTRGNNE